ncbi:GPI transamidase component PIG-T [Galendromus occidentalis]|uniref:GPI transamidase component PIG-T n=1 Tax=Galendromus occidentalis TaxID=34638 RepID=A0AAJ6QR53_9ACAR|nr:GPI transamidase component PIG-T [Galendromus occidentalis]
MNSRLLLVVLLCGISRRSSADETFIEELFVKPLPSGHLYSFFSFTTTLNNPAENMRFYRLLPSTIGDLLQINSVDEFHLSLTQGKWSHEQYGYPIKDRPAGAVLWAWFKENPDLNWKKFASALGGVTCSSLNFIDDTITVVPKYVFRPEGHIQNLNDTNLKYAMLPGEAVCTENLTPWLKFLPCSNAGLSQLLRATSIFSTHYISIGLDVKKLCLDQSCLQTQLLLQQHVSIVFDATIATGKQEWSFIKLFGKTISSVCPLAARTSVIVETTDNGVCSKFALAPEPHRLEENGDASFAIYDVKRLLTNSDHVNIVANPEKSHTYWTIKPPPLTINRYVQGYGLESGGVRTVIVNSAQKALNVTYLEVIPWYLRVYVHTLRITSNGKQVFPNRIVFQPSLDREKPCHLEIGLNLAARSKTELSFSFERAFLAWVEYPPDPHLGFYVGAASLTLSVPREGLANFTGDLSTSGNLEEALLGSHTSQHRSLVLFTEILLVTLPTPDFSMPYNVICFVCTAIALAFGPIYNVTTKNLTLQDKNQKKGLLHTIVQKLKGVSVRKLKKE